MTDFLCIKVDGELMVRECVQRKHLTKPMTIKLLDMSLTYWTRHTDTHVQSVRNTRKKERSRAHVDYLKGGEPHGS